MSCAAASGRRWSCRRRSPRCRRAYRRGTRRNPHVGCSDRADLHVAGLPHDLGDVPRLEGDHVQARDRPPWVHGALQFHGAVGRLAGLVVSVVDMGDEFFAAYVRTGRRLRVVSTDDVEVRTPRSSKHPAHLDEVGEAFRVVGMHVREEGRVELRRWMSTWASRISVPRPTSNCIRTDRQSFESLP